MLRNPVRAGMVSDPADYRWSGYGEAVGGGTKGNGKKSREGIVRACMSHKCGGFEAEMLESEDNETVLPDLGMAGMLRKRVRYFTDGAVQRQRGCCGVCGI